VEESAEGAVTGEPFGGSNGGEGKGTMAWDLQRAAQQRHRMRH
jgi:hypothetical protein